MSTAQKNMKKFIKQIEFKEDFRCFKKGQIIEFREGINFIVGDQGIGKSTLLQCLTEKFGTIVQITYDKDAEFMYFDTEKNNPRVKSEAASMFTINSIFESHGETMFPILSHMKKIKDKVMLIDEPESGLSLRSICKLIKVFKFAETKNNCQLIIATHNLQFIQSVQTVYSLEHNEWMYSDNFILSQYK